MNGFQRFFNVMVEKFLDTWSWYADGLQIGSVRNHFGQDVPDFYDVSKKRSAMFLANSHFITHGIWPTYPNFVDIGGKASQRNEETEWNSQSLRVGSRFDTFFVTFR